MPLFGINPRKWGRNKDVDAVVIAEHHYPIHARIGVGRYQELVARARLCHASQLGGVGPRRISQVIASMIFGVQDHYMRYYPPVSGRVRETDLFAGL
jgi:N-acetyl-1-D-myo-inositol-2-amino-2-deoxy-alpha-D-glucopyranoside deacetylase/mycothiol S-conjugate amidase